MILFLLSFKKGKVFLEGGTIATNAPSQLHHNVIFKLTWD